MIQPVTDEASHKKALRRAEQLWDAEPGSSGERELDALATLIDVYELSDAYRAIYIIHAEGTGGSSLCRRGQQA